MKTTTMNLGEVRAYLRSEQFSAERWLFTQNKTKEGRDNFRRKGGYWLNGDWKGQPQQPHTKIAYWVVDDYALYIGDYSGEPPLYVGDQRYAVKMVNVEKIQVTSPPDENQHTTKKLTLKKLLEPEILKLGTSYTYWSASNLTSQKIPYADLESAKQYNDVVVIRAISTRRGQVVFRKKLCSAYENKCAISGCVALPVLEAAHIQPHSERGSYDESNGLLLRSDLHVLFDLGLIGIDEKFKVCVSTKLKEPEYTKFDGTTIALPKTKEHLPSKKNLKARMAKFHP